MSAERKGRADGSGVSSAALSGALDRLCAGARGQETPGSPTPYVAFTPEHCQALLAEYDARRVRLDAARDEIERRAAEMSRLYDGYVEMARGIWVLYERAQASARRESPVG